MNNKRIVVVGQSAKEMLDDNKLRQKNLDLLKQWTYEENHSKDRTDDEEK